MRRNLLVIFFTLIFAGNLFAQNPLVKQWDKRFGGTDDDYLCSFQQTSDGGYILGGITASEINGDKTEHTCHYNGNTTTDYWIIKIDSLGNKQWDKDFGGRRWDNLMALQQTSDGGYILGGHSNSEISCKKTEGNWDSTLQTTDYWIVKTDSLGNKLWDKRFGGTNWENFNSIKHTIDGGYILGGTSWSGISGDKTQPLWDTCTNCSFAGDYWIVKTDSGGNKLWDKRFGGMDFDFLTSLQQTKDNGYILGGRSTSGISGDKTQANWDTTIGFCDYWIVKTDSIGNKIWDKRFGGIGLDLLYSIQQTSDDGYILGGYSNSGISGDKTQDAWKVWNGLDSVRSFDYWIVKTDSLGNKLWDKRYGGTWDEDEYGSISQTFDGGYLISGISQSFLSGDKTEDNLQTYQEWVVKTDAVGNKLWDKTIFTNPAQNQFDGGGLAIQENNGCYVLANRTSAGIGGYKSQPNWDPGAYTYDYWIIKFCDTTSATSINQILNSQLPFSIYPNPTNTTLNLYLNNNENIVITNILGEIVLQRDAMGKVELDVSFLSSGIYFIKVGNEVRKFVKE